MKENAFQAGLKKEIKARFPGCYVFKNNDIQGFPDLTILHGNRWATLETKRNLAATKRPNQSYHVEKLNEMSYSAFISPENKEAVLNELQQAFES